MSLIGGKSKEADTFDVSASDSSEEEKGNSAKIQENYKKHQEE